jgi:hypothetical protein
VILPTEGWFVVALFLLRVYDATDLLSAREVVFLQHGAGWRAAFPAGGARWRGGHLFLHPLLVPQAAQAARWLRASPAGDGLTEPLSTPFWAALRAFRIPLVLLSLTQFVLLPVVLLGLGIGWTLVGVIALLYLQLLCLCIQVHWRRGALRLAPRQAWSLCFEAVSCPPFAPGLPRRVCALVVPIGDALAFAAGQLDGPARQAFRSEAERRLVTERMMLDDTDGGSAAALDAVARRLEETLT